MSRLQPSRPMMRAVRGTSRRHFNARRNGASTIEFALVAVPLFLFFFACFEFCRAMMAMNTLEEAARGGCRAAIIKGATLTSVEDEIVKLLGVSGVSDYELQIEPQDFEQHKHWIPLSVSISAPYAEISWLPAPLWLQETKFTASCTLPKECSPDE